VSVTDWRDPIAPVKTVYNGMTFDSLIESECARHLDNSNVRWSAQVRTGASVPYKVDFEILEAAEHWQLPRYIEVKPQPMLYALRAIHRLPEFFDGEVAVRADLEELNLRGFKELIKPLRLADEADCEVLIVGEVNCSRKLSAFAQSGFILTFTRSQPWVNAQTYYKKLEDERRKLAWRAEQEAREQVRRAEREAQHKQFVQDHRSFEERLGSLLSRAKPAQYGQLCEVCRRWCPPDRLLIVKIDTKWVAWCSDDGLEL
jgi:hypothetical protein